MPFLSLAFSSGIPSAAANYALPKIFNHVGRWWSGIDDDLERLDRVLLKIQSLIDDIENKHSMSKACNLLIEDCKGVILDSDDLWDEIFLECCSQANESSGLKVETKGKVGNMLETGKKMLLELNGYYSSEMTKPRPAQSWPISSRSSFAIGMKKEMDQIRKLLAPQADSEAENVHVISIVGMGGIGKTTLAQLVYNDSEVVREFDLRIWVSVSSDFDLVKITKSILESSIINSTDDNDSASKNALDLANLDRIRIQLKMILEGLEMSNLDCIRIQLKRILEGKRFLLVLDDVWNESTSHWDELKSFFSFAEAGSSPKEPGPSKNRILASKVLVTTRSEIVSSIVSTTGEIVSPSTFSDEDCWEIIKKNLKTKVDNREDLKAIGKKLAEKCRSLPLAAKVIGDVLRLKSKEMEWDSLLKCDIWDLPEYKNHVYPVLKRSYDHVPAHLKRCFAYFSIIPQSKKIEVKDLINIWAAQGFILSQGARRMEDIGMEYIQELRSRSFLQIESNGVKMHDEVKMNDKVKMHDFIHDLARLVSTNLCLALEDTTPCFFPVTNVRHLSLLCRSTESHLFEKKLEESYCYKKLRTFMLYSLSSQLLGNLTGLEDLKRLFETFKLLRVLNLSGSGISSLSETVGNFIHLRYLNLSDTYIKKLPPTIVDLYELETLELMNCTSLNAWPENLHKMIKLRHLYFDRHGQMSSMPKKLGKLISLEELDTFAVTSQGGYGIEELQNLNCLRGSITIKDLQNLSPPPKAQDAKLENKQYLEKLKLHWEEDQSPTYQTNLLHRQVLEGLRPHDWLKEFEVKGYHGSDLPDWFGKPLSTNSPSQYSVKLEKLFIKSCWRLVKLPSIRHITSLEELEIDDCPILPSLPDLPDSLSTLKISRSGKLKLRCAEGGADWEKIQSITCVQIDDVDINTEASVRRAGN